VVSKLKNPWRDGTTPPGEVAAGVHAAAGCAGATPAAAPATESFKAVNSGGPMPGLGREETLDPQPDSRHPVSPMSASSDRPATRYVPGKAPVQQATTALVDR
jgi:hypothetical protein